MKAADVETRKKPSNYPEPFASRMQGRSKRSLGDIFGLSNFGVNLTTLQPGAVSALQHSHSKQDEFVYIVEGELWLVSGDEQERLSSGYCVGFPAGGVSHHLENRSETPALYLEIGDRTEGDEVVYPVDDLKALRESGAWVFTRKDGTPY
ncbi:MAG TPA: cupin domain-containing protein [Pseudorhizobium sp.]|nr:cupin domain-containing protein [Pseudorhizobium sp.]